MCIIDVAPSSYFSCTIATLAPSFHTIYYVPKDKFSSSSSLSSKSLQQPIHKGSHQQFEDWYTQLVFWCPKMVSISTVRFYSSILSWGVDGPRVLFNLGWGCTPGPCHKNKVIEFIPHGASEFELTRCLKIAQKVLFYNELIPYSHIFLNFRAKIHNKNLSL